MRLVGRWAGGRVPPAPFSSYVATRPPFVGFDYASLLTVRSVPYHCRPTVWLASRGVDLVDCEAMVGEPMKKPIFTVHAAVPGQRAAGVDLTKPGEAMA